MNIGIIGGGQLAQMMALAGYAHGHSFVVLDPSKEACGAKIANQHIEADYNDPAALRQLAKLCDVVTFDFENVPADALALLESHVTTYPPSQALSIAQDRLTEKNHFTQYDIETAPFADVNDLTELKAAIERIGLPGILKTRRLGYDGKGQFVIRDIEQLDDAIAAMNGQPSIYEGMVNFDYEVSLISVRNAEGECVFYPLSKNTHQSGILHLSEAPFSSETLQNKAETLAKPLLDAMNYVGVLAIEWFVVGDVLIANEMAPRVHNSGHWSIEGAVCSQFENHIRAITGSPLGSTQTIGHSRMLNCIGDIPNANDVLKKAGAHMHDYGKEPRAKRKVGHITIHAQSLEQAEKTTAELLPLLTPID